MNEEVAEQVATPAAGEIQNLNQDQNGQNEAAAAQTPPATSQDEDQQQNREKPKITPIAPSALEKDVPKD
ncbi:MAG: hypothetical protein HOE30_14135, partial [Deltaproteobacteria bacterium]|nr:hypothetical protein [Deltaproteobacteria bacterium]